MKRIVSWAAIIMLAFSTYLNVFLSLGEMEETEASANQNNTSVSAEKAEAGNKKEGFMQEEDSRLSFKTNSTVR